MKFRGIRMDNGALKEGNLVTRNCDGFSRTYIYDNSCDEVEIDEYCGDCDNETIKLKDLFIAVHPDSVSMETGQKDKNGVMIFGSIPIDGKMSRGGDICQILHEVSTGSVRHSRHSKSGRTTGHYWTDKTESKTQSGEVKFTKDRGILGWFVDLPKTPSTYPMDSKTTFDYMAGGLKPLSTEFEVIGKQYEVKK